MSTAVATPTVRVCLAIWERFPLLPHSPGRAVVLLHWPLGIYPSSAQAAEPPIWPNGWDMCWCASQDVSTCQWAWLDTHLGVTCYSLIPYRFSLGLQGTQFLVVACFKKLQGGTVRVWLRRGYVPAGDDWICISVHHVASWWQELKAELFKHYNYTTALKASLSHVDALEGAELPTTNMKDLKTCLKYSINPNYKICQSNMFPTLP